MIVLFQNNFNLLGELHCPFCPCVRCAFLSGHGQTFAQKGHSSAQSRQKSGQSGHTGIKEFSLEHCESTPRCFHMQQVLTNCHVSTYIFCWSKKRELCIDVNTDQMLTETRVQTVFILSIFTLSYCYTGLCTGYTVILVIVLFCIYQIPHSLVEFILVEGKAIRFLTTLFMCRV